MKNRPTESTHTELQPPIFPLKGLSSAELKGKRGKGGGIFRVELLCFKDVLHKKDRALVMQSSAFERGFDNFVQLGFACQNSRDGFEMTLGGIRNDLRPCVLACARRPPQNDGREQLIGFDGAVQKFPLAHAVFFPKYSSSVRGLMRAASGASLFMRSCRAWSKRSGMERFYCYLQ